MKSLTRSTMGILLVSFLFVFSTSAAMAQDPVTANPDRYKVLLENDQVRVLEAHAKPGEKEKASHHGATVMYTLAPSKAKFTRAGGKSEVREFKAGQVDWTAGETHAVEVVGNNEAHVFLVELKKPGKRGKTVRGADPAKIDPKHFKVRLNNASVRVLEFRAKPGDKVPMHAHPNYVAYNLSGGKTRFTSAEGKTEEREAVEGSASWNESERHAAEIVGNTEAHSLLIELKSPRAKAKM